MYACTQVPAEEGSSTRLHKLHPRRCVAGTRALRHWLSLGFNAMLRALLRRAKQTRPLQPVTTAAAAQACPAAVSKRARFSRLAAGYREGQWKGGWRNLSLDKFFVILRYPPPRVRPRGWTADDVCDLECSRHCYYYCKQCDGTGGPTFAGRGRARSILGRMVASQRRHPFVPHCSAHKTHECHVPAFRCPPNAIHSAVH